MPFSIDGAELGGQFSPVFSIGARDPSSSTNLSSAFGETRDVELLETVGPREAIALPEYWGRYPVAVVGERAPGSTFPLADPFFNMVCHSSFPDLALPMVSFYASPPAYLMIPKHTLSVLQLFD
jgi:hypothetical protein